MNWLENGANETADTETGTYNLASINPGNGELAPRTQGSRYFLPTNVEWLTALSTILSPVGYFEWSDAPSIYQNGAYFMYKYSIYDGGIVAPGVYADGPGRGAGLNGGEISFRIASVSSYGPDAQAPVITLFGPDPIQIYRGSAFTDPGANVTDNVDSTRTITASGTVNTTIVGIYTLTYTTQDAAGNLAVPVTRTVNVVLDPNGDEDGDGLTNGAEISGGTNPYQKDTDGDGVNDPVEIADGTNPNDSSSCNQLSRGLVAYYRFSGNLFDSSGNGRNLAAQGFSYVGGIQGQSLRFSAPNSRADYLGHPPGQDASNFTYSLWLNPRTLSRWPEWMYLVGGKAELRLGVNQVYPGHYKVLNFGSDNITNLGWAGTDPLEEIGSNRWNHMAITQSGTVLKIFLNGKLILGPLDWLSRTFDLNNFFFGNQGGYTYAVDGEMDEIRLYQRALSDEEVAQIYVILVVGHLVDNSLTYIFYGPF